MESPVPVLASAYRHGITDEQIAHALAHPIRYVNAEDDLSMVVGPDATGRLLEIGIAWVDAFEGMAVVHAMPARPRFLRR